MMAMEYSAWIESNPERWACVIGQAVVPATAAAGTTSKIRAVSVIPPTGNLPPHHTIPVRALGNADGAEGATEAGTNNPPVMGG